MDEYPMWEIERPKRVKLIIGIMASDQACLSAALDAIGAEFGPTDFLSEVWPFKQTDYYEKQTGYRILKQFVSIEKLIGPGELGQIKRRTNAIERRQAELLHSTGVVWPRPINLDPGIIEPSKLVLASTKNYSHRIYIGEGIYAEVTLTFHKGKWQPFKYTYPDYKQPGYHEFFSKVRNRLIEHRRDT